MYSRIIHKTAFLPAQKAMQGKPLAEEDAAYLTCSSYYIQSVILEEPSNLLLTGLGTHGKQ